MKATVFNGKPSGPPAEPALNERTGAQDAHSHLPGSGPFLALLYITTTLPICFFRCR